MNKTRRLYLFFMGFMLSLAACKENEVLAPDYAAPSELPAELVTGTVLGDNILGLFNDLGVVVYTDPTSPRFSTDLVSSERLTLREARLPADTAAALLAIELIKRELYDQLPEGYKRLMPRNFYFLKTPLVAGTAAVQYVYQAYVWTNSMADVTLGGLNDATVDAAAIKRALFYAMGTILRQVPELSDYYQRFIQAKTNAGVYYWQVTTIESAYDRGFVTNDQRQISSNDLDFACMAAWAATVDPGERDILLGTNAHLAEKYNLIVAMFRQAGIPIEDINTAWQASPYNPNNDSSN